MIIKSAEPLFAGSASGIPLGLSAFWVALVAFALALAFYRKLSPVYRTAAWYYAAAGLAYAAPYIGMLAGFPPVPVTLVLIAVVRVLLMLVTDRACEGLAGKPWRVISWAVGALVAASGLAALALPPAWSLLLEAGALAVLALHALLAVVFFAMAARTVPAAIRLVGGSVPWALLWTAAAALAAARLLGNDVAAGFGDYLPLALSAADALMGATVLLAAMVELAKPAPEDTALDDYAARMTTTMHCFIPTEFLQHLQKTEFFDLKLGDHVKKEMTIFFSDIRAFTELSEQLTPEQSFAFINSYLSRVVPVINEHGGFVDKYMGDGIMALFAEKSGADEAVASAVEMQGKILEYNGHRANMGYRPISMGIGIHTGQLMLGVVGVVDRMEGTVISDAVNLSSRLQQIAKAFNIPLVISEQTFMQLEDPGKYKYRFIGKVRVKGKDAPVSAFEIFDGLPEELFERKMRSNTFFEQGMLAYYQKDYSQGVFYFKRALESVHDDGASRFYLETCLRKAMSPKAS